MKYLIADINNHQGPWMPVVTPGKPGHPWHQTVHHLPCLPPLDNHRLCVQCHNVHICALCAKSVRSKTVKNVHGGEPFVQFGVKCGVCNMKCALRSVTCALCCAKCAKCAVQVLAPVCWAGRRPGDPSHAARSTPLCHHHFEC